MAILLLSIVLIGALLHFLNFEYEKIPEMLNEMGFFALVLILVITIVEFVLKIVRFDVTLEKKLGVNKLLIPYFRGTFLSYLVPIRLLGEGARAPIFKKDCDISYSQSLASISIERLTDMLLITFVVFYAVSFFNVWISGLLLFSFFVFILVMKTKMFIKIMKMLPENKIFNFIISYAEILNLLLNNPIKMLKVSILTIVCWTLAYGRIWLILFFLGENIGFVNVITATSIAYLSSLLSILPGGLIGFEGGGIATLMLMGINKEIAIFTIFIERIYSFWLFLIVGIIIEGIRKIRKI